jgi:urease accessory protein
VEAMGQMEGFTHQASLLWVKDRGLGGARARVEEWLAGIEGIVHGVSEGPANSLVIRLLGNKAEQLYDCLKEVVKYAS